MSARRVGGSGIHRGARAAAAAAALGIGVVGLTGCSEDSAGPEAGAVSVEDLEEIEDRVAELGDRVGALEEGVVGGVADDVMAEDDTQGLFGDARSQVGEEVTVSAAISEMIPTTDVGAAFRIAGASGESVAVISATPPPELDADDVVRVWGTAVEVQQDSFEDDFGVAAHELLDDPALFFELEEGSVAVAADRMEVLQEQGQDG